MNAAVDRNDAPAGKQSEPLSRFEGRCLWRRTRECEELLQLAVLGVEGAQARRGSDDEALSQIAELLREAERAVEVARQIAIRWNR
jgi:hypothetical protein